LCTNWLLKHVIEGKLKRKIEGKRRGGRRRKHKLEDLQENMKYRYLKKEALGRSVWRTRFGRSCGPVVRQTSHE
jgi:hypothetical protein